MRAEDNDTLTRTDAGTPMGALFRRYWLPALASDELPEPDGSGTYTTTHFKTEEKYFAEFSYPEAPNHKKEHAAFVQKVSAFRDDFEHGRLTVSIEVLYFLRDWLQKHIKGADKRYSSFFNEKGLH